jgi:hypothetical protein
MRANVWENKSTKESCPNTRHGHSIGAQKGELPVRGVAEVNFWQAESVPRESSFPHELRDILWTIS